MGLKRLIIVILLTVSANSGLAKTALLLDDPGQSFNVRIDMINKAGQGDSIALTYYIVKDDFYGLTLLDSLLRAAKRGAKIRFLVDDFQNKVSAALWAMTELYDEFEVKFFRPFPNLNPRTIGRRLHDKFIILNGKEIIFGGRNIGSEYFSPYTNWIDTDVWMDGPIAAEAKEYFNEIWNNEKSKKAKFGRYAIKDDGTKEIFQHCKDQKSPSHCLSNRKDDLWTLFFKKCHIAGKGSKRAKCSQRFNRIHKTYVKWWKAREDIADSQDFFASLYDVRKAHYEAEAVPYESAVWLDNHENVTDWRRGVSDDSLSGVLYEEIGNATERIWMAAPYLIATKAMRAAFEKADEATNSRVDMIIATNSLLSADHNIVTLASMGRQKKLEDHGVQIYRRGYEGLLHSKVTVIDFDKVFISSFNMDPRSEKLNSESGALIVSEELNRKAAASLIRVFRDSWLDDEERVNRKLFHKDHLGFWDHVFNGLQDTLILNIPGAEEQL